MEKNIDKMGWTIERRAQINQQIIPKKNVTANHDAMADEFSPELSLFFMTVKTLHKKSSTTPKGAGKNLSKRIASSKLMSNILSYFNVKNNF